MATVATIELARIDATSAHSPEPSRISPIETVADTSVVINVRNAMMWNDSALVTRASGTTPAASAITRSPSTGTTTARSGVP